MPEDVAGGLKLATGLSWRSEIRLCILIADAPPHGCVYHHRGMEDRYPRGCPKGHDPSKLLYNLQVRRVCRKWGMIVCVVCDFVSERVL